MTTTDNQDILRNVMCAMYHPCFLYIRINILNLSHPSLVMVKSSGRGIRGGTFNGITELLSIELHVELLSIEIIRSFIFCTVR